MTHRNSINEGPARDKLNELHTAAKADHWRFVAKAPRILAGLLSGKPIAEVLSGDLMSDCFIPVSREQGDFLYPTARSINAKTIVEFGTSFGISTIYLAAALQDSGEGAVISTELDPTKCKAAQINLEDAGVAQHAEVRQGDALQTLHDLAGPVDLVLLDAWKDLYLPILELIRPQLREGSVVLADNIFTFRKALRAYVEYMQSGENGFYSTTLDIADGFEYSVYLG
jgi:predicted O-methyltransferase YrrM